MAYQGATTYLKNSVTPSDSPEVVTQKVTGYQGAATYMKKPASLGTGYKGASSYGDFQDSGTTVGSELFSAPSAQPSTPTPETPVINTPTPTPVSFFQRIVNFFNPTPVKLQPAAPVFTQNITNENISKNFGTGAPAPVLPEGATGSMDIQGTMEQLRGDTTALNNASDQSYVNEVLQNSEILKDNVLNGFKAGTIQDAQSFEEHTNIVEQLKNDPLKTLDSWRVAFGDFILGDTPEKRNEAKNISEQIRVLVDEYVAGKTTKEEYDRKVKPLEKQLLDRGTEIALNVFLLFGGAESGNVALRGTALIAKEAIRLGEKDAIAALLRGRVDDAVLLKVSKKLAKTTDVKVAEEVIARNSVSAIAARKAISEQGLLQFARDENAAGGKLELVPVKAIEDGSTIQTIENSATGKTTIYVTPEVTSGDFAKAVAGYVEKKYPQIAKDASLEIKALTGGIDTPRNDFMDAVKRITADVSARAEAPILTSELQKIGINLGADEIRAEGVATRAKTTSLEHAKAPIEKTPKEPSVSSNAEKQVIRETKAKPVIPKEAEVISERIKTDTRKLSKLQSAQKEFVSSKGSPSQKIAKAITKTKGKIAAGKKSLNELKASVVKKSPAKSREPLNAKVSHPVASVSEPSATGKVSIKGNEDFKKAVREMSPTEPEKTNPKVFARFAGAVSKRFTRFREVVQDSQIRVKQLQKKVISLGFAIPEKANPYIAQELMLARIDARHQEVSAVFDALDKDILASAKILKMSDSALQEDIQKYLVAKHAPEYNLAHGDGAAGITTADSHDFLRAFEKTPQAADVKRIAEVLKSESDKTLEVLHDGQIITDELYQTLKEKYPNYVPLQRIMDETDAEDVGQILMGRGLDIKSTGIMRAKGSKREVSNIFTSIQANLNQAIIKAEKNRVDLATLEFHRAFPQLEFAEEIKLPMIPVANITHSAVVDKKFENNLIELAKSLGAKFKRTGQPGKILGRYKPGEKLITRKFATPREVVSHETAHFFDHQFGLKQRFYAKGESKALAKEMRYHMIRSGESTARMANPKERFADAFEWWMTHRDLAKRDMPLFSAEMKKIIKDIPELKPLLKIEPKPALSIETMNEVIFRRKQFTNDPNVLRLMEKGNPTYLKIHDAQLAQAMKGTNISAVPAEIAFISKYTRFLGSLATRFSLNFAPSNIFRDAQEMAIIVSATPGLGAGAAGSALSKEASSLKTVFQKLHGVETADTKLYKQMLMDGGATGYVDLTTKKAIDLNWEKIQKLNRSNPRKAAHTLLQGVENFNTLFEDATRFSVYKTALERGMSRQEAASMAKNATINFNRKGTGGALINSLYMFSNATIQGSTNTLRAMKNKKVAAAVISSVVIPTFGVGRWNDAVDPEWRSKVTKGDRQNNFIIVIPSTDGSKYVTLPVSWGIKPMKVIADYLYDSSRGKGDTAQTLASNIVTAILQAYNPLGGTNLLTSVIPTFAQLPAQIAANKDWKGSMIRPDWMKGLPMNEQVFPSTAGTPVADTVIAGTSALDKVTGGFISLSPEDVLYVYQQITAGAGGSVTQIVNSIGGIAKGEIPKPSDIPFISRFYKNIPQDRLVTIGKSLEKSKVVADLQAADPTERTQIIQDYLTSLSDNDARKSAAFSLYSMGFSIKGVHTSDVAISAAGLFAEMKKMNRDEANARLAEIQKTEPKVAQYIREFAKADRQTPEMKELNTGTVNDRAKKIYDKIMSLPEGQRHDYYQSLKDVGVVTSAVNTALNKLKK